MESVSIDSNYKVKFLCLKMIFGFRQIFTICRYVTSWIETRTIPAEKSNLVILFDKYIPPCLETVRTRFKKITPIADMAHVQMLCHLLNCLLVPENTPADCPKEWHDVFFVFACVWAFGSAMFQDTNVDYRIGELVKIIIFSNIVVFM